MKRVGFSLWKGLWLIFVQSDIKTCSSLPPPYPHSDPQINAADLIKFEASYKFYLSWQKKRMFISCAAFTLYLQCWLRVVWFCGSGAHTTVQRHYEGNKWHCQWLPWQNSILWDQNNVQKHRKCENVTLGQHGTIQRVQPNTENFLKPAFKVPVLKCVVLAWLGYKTSCPTWGDGWITLGLFLAGYLVILSHTGTSL